MTILYRVLGFIINVFALFIAMALVFIIPASLTVPPLWLPVFMFVAIVLYTWFSQKFQRLVLIQQKPVRASLRDWIRVNGFVTIVSCILNISPIIALLRNPAAYIAAMKAALTQLGPQYEQSFKPESLTSVAIVMVVYLLILLVHVLWTFALIKKNREFFQ